MRSQSVLILLSVVMAVLCTVLIAGCGGGGGGPVDTTAANVATSALNNASQRLAALAQTSGDREQAATELAAELSADTTISNVVKGDGIITFEKGGGKVVLFYRDLGTESSEDSSLGMKSVQALAVRDLPGNKKALVLNAEPDIFNRTPVRVKERLEGLGYSVDYVSGSDVTLARMKTMGQYGVVYFSGHGNKGLWATGQEWTDQWKNDANLVGLWNSGEIYLGKVPDWTIAHPFSNEGRRIAITPKFIQDQLGQFNQTIVFAYSCLTMADTTLADAFTAKGAQVYCGWDTEVLMNFQGPMRTLIDKMAGGTTLDTAVAEVGNPHLRYQYSTAAHDAKITDTSLTIANSLPGYDDIGAVLTGLGYSTTGVDINNLSSNGLSGYSTYAVNCSSDVQDVSPAATDEVRRFVENGGRLYCSDWAFAVVQTAFPGKLTFYDDPYIGDSCSTTATVNDSELAGFLGTGSVGIEFDLAGWVPIKAVGSGVTVLLSGSYQYEPATLGRSGSRPPHDRRSSRSATTRADTSGPIAVSFQYGSGRVVYTSFHLHAQGTGTNRALMEYLALY